MPEGIPVAKVSELRSRGLDNNKIIESLRSENYSFQQIRDAIQQADIKSSVSNTAGTPPPQTTPMPPQPSTQPVTPTPKPENPMPPQPSNTQSAPPMPPRQKSSIDLDEIQRVLEEIIAEKWKESEKTIQELLEWKSAVNTKIKDFETRMSEFNSRIESLTTVLGQKAEAFNETMTNVDTEIKALEKALNKLVPTLSDNISELKGLVSDMNK